ncbi:T9SS type A sorting domain-containing protein [bacterium]|nr:T9SS type A sorting domain-containing protein [bacterium]
MKRKVTILSVILLVLGFSLSYGQVFTEDFEDSDVSEWEQYRIDEEMIQAVDMASVPQVLLEGGEKVGYIQDIDGSYSGAAILLTGDVTDADYTVEANFYVYDDAPPPFSAYTGVVAYGDSSQGYYVKLVADFDGSDRLRLFNNQFDPSTFTYTMDYSIPAADFDQSEGWHYMKIEVSTDWSDNSVSYHCYYDENDLGSFVDDAAGHTYQGMPGVYAFQQDEDGLPGYFDNFRVVANDGTSIDEAVINQPLTMTLNQNYPNPFNPSTTLSFDITEGGEAGLKIYNIKGGLVRTLAQGYIQPGSYRLTWDGADQQGQVVAAGNYIVVLTKGNEQLSRSMLLIK